MSIKLIIFVSSKTNDAAATNAILKSALRYGSIYSETRHIGPPQKVYDLFYKWASIMKALPPHLMLDY